MNEKESPTTPPNGKESPSTFQIAQLAAVLLPQVRSELPDCGLGALDKWPGHKLADAAQLAVELWGHADRARLNQSDAAEQIKELKKHLFVDSPEEWKARIDEFKGHSITLQTFLDAPWAYTMDEVGKKLFLNKSISRDSRRKLVQGLIDRLHQSLQKRNELSHGAYSARACRLLVEERQKQIKVQKSRLVPQRRRYGKAY